MDSAKETFRSHCFDDDGLASIAEMETGFHGRNRHLQYPIVSRSLQRKPSFRNVSWGSSFVSSPRSPGKPRSFFAYGKFFEEPHQSHFLDSCFLCKKTLGGNKDIFMYRGDTPFCSEECRQEQIEMDEIKEQSRNLSASMRAMRKKEQIKSSSSSTRTTRDCNFRSDSITAAS